MTTSKQGHRGGHTGGNGSRIFLVDVEATGQSSYSGIMTEFGVVDLESGNWFRGVLWDSHPDPEVPARPVPEKENPRWTVGYNAHDLDSGFTRSAKDAKQVAVEHTKWLNHLAAGRRITLMSDNPGYDFERVNVFFDQVGLPNPYGFSSRRIGDLYAGLTQQFGNTSRWKGLRETSHTHESHSDSMGNREAVLKLQTAMRKLSALYPNLAADLKTILKDL